MRKCFLHVKNTNQKANACLTHQQTLEGAILHATRHCMKVKPADALIRLGRAARQLIPSWHINTLDYIRLWQLLWSRANRGANLIMSEVAWISAACVYKAVKGNKIKMVINIDIKLLFINTFTGFMFHSVLQMCRTVPQHRNLQSLKRALPIFNHNMNQTITPAGTYKYMSQFFHFKLNVSAHACKWTHKRQSPVLKTLSNSISVLMYNRWKLQYFFVFLHFFFFFFKWSIYQQPFSIRDVNKCKREEKEKTKSKTKQRAGGRM